MVIKYYDKDELCSVITVNQSSGTVCVSNYTDNNIKRAFGVNENPTMADFEEFLEDRCIPIFLSVDKYEASCYNLFVYVTIL